MTVNHSVLSVSADSGRNNYVTIADTQEQGYPKWKQVLNNIRNLRLREVIDLLLEELNLRKFEHGHRIGPFRNVQYMCIPSRGSSRTSFTGRGILLDRALLEQTLSQSGLTLETWSQSDMFYPILAVSCQGILQNGGGICAAVTSEESPKALSTKQFSPIKYLQIIPPHLDVTILENQTGLVIEYTTQWRGNEKDTN